MITAALVYREDDPKQGLLCVHLTDENCTIKQLNKYSKEETEEHIGVDHRLAALRRWAIGPLANQESEYYQLKRRIRIERRKRLKGY